MYVLVRKLVSLKDSLKIRTREGNSQWILTINLHMRQARWQPSSNCMGWRQLALTRSKSHCVACKVTHVEIKTIFSNRIEYDSIFGAYYLVASRLVFVCRLGRGLVYILVDTGYDIRALSWQVGIKDRQENIYIVVARLHEIFLGTIRWEAARGATLALEISENDQQNEFWFLIASVRETCIKFWS